MSARRLRFPLALQVSLWLGLNLVLLAALAGVYVFFFGRLDDLVAGRSGDRLQAVANVIGAELRTDPENRADEVLARFSAAYGVELFLFNVDARQVGGPDVTLPTEVVQRLPAGRGRAGPPPGRGPLANPPLVAPDAGPDAPPASADPRPAREGPAAAPVVPGRFLVRTTEPVVYWAGARLPAPEGRQRPPLILLLRAPSLGSTSLLFDPGPFALGGGVALGVSILFWLPFVGRITRSLRSLTRAAERISEGRFETRVDERRRDELGRLGHAVNRMAGQLDQLVGGQKRFLGDIAHELGSPLGRMQLGVGILEERAGPALQAAVADVREEVQHMSALVHELLAFTKAGLRPRDAALTPLNLASLASRVLDREDPASRVVATVPAELVVLGDADLLARALGNLVRNALRHAGDAGPITLAAAPDPESRAHILVTLDDHGPGVPPDTLARLGEPFYRPESARTRETGGAGLGLAIVKSAALACGGSVEFANRAPTGFRAVLRLQAAPAATAA